MAVRLCVTYLLFAVCLSGCQRTIEQTAHHPLDQFDERNDDPLAAAADRYQRRLSENGRVPDGALLRAKSQRDSLSRMQFENADVGNLPVNWEWLGPGNIGGRLRPIVINPKNPDVMYVGSASGGIWKSIDAGENWFVLDDFLASLAIADMVMHPDDTNTLLAGTGEGFFETTEGSSNTAAVRGAGIFITTDAGATWNQIPATNTPDFYFVNRIEFDPTDSSTILIATNTGIWRSTDNGVSWNLQAAFHALDVKFNPNDPTKVVAGGHDTEDGPYYSTDRGLTWQIATGAGGERQEIAWAPSESNTVYAAVSDDFGIRIWESNDNGQNYALKTTGASLQTWAGYNNTIWVHPTDADYLVVGGVRLHRSTDGGANFSQTFNGAHADMHRIVQHPGFDGLDNSTVYFATDGGIYRANDVNQSAVTSLNNNLGVTQFYGGAINPESGNIIGGTQDNGTLFYDGNPQNWRAVFGGDGGYGAADPTDPDYFYGEVQRARIHRSTNGGVGSNSYIYNGPNPIGDASGLDTNFIPFFMLDPNDSNRMLVACERMWRSNNVKATTPDWFVVKNSIDPSGRPARKTTQSNSHFAENSPYNLSTIAVAKGNSDIIWAAHNNGSLYYSNDGTATEPSWTRVDENGSGLPDRWISTVVIDPRDHEHVYIAFMGWDNDNLWETTDNGETWVEISGTGPMSIPDAPISALAIHPSVAGLLYVGTDVGIFVSDDNGLMWSSAMDPKGPGNVPVEQLLWKDDNTLLVVTHGRGMYLATESIFEASGFEVLVGRQNGGNLQSLASNDGDFLGLSPTRTIIRSGQTIEVDLVSASGTTSPSVFQFRLQALLRGGQDGEVFQNVSLWNYTTQQFEHLDSTDVTTSDDALLVVPAGDVSRFVDPQTMEVKVRLFWRRDAFVRRPFTWSIDVDEAVWLIAE